MESLPIEVLLVRPLLVQPMRLDVFAQERGSVTNAMQGETYPFFPLIPFNRFTILLWLRAKYVSSNFSGYTI